MSTEVVDREGRTSKRPWENRSPKIHTFDADKLVQDEVEASSGGPIGKTENGLERDSRLTSYGQTVNSFESGVETLSIPEFSSQIEYSSSSTLFPPQSVDSSSTLQTQANSLHKPQDQRTTIDWSNTHYSSRGLSKTADNGIQTPSSLQGLLPDVSRGHHNLLPRGTNRETQDFSRFGTGIGQLEVNKDPSLDSLTSSTKTAPITNHGGTADTIQNSNTQNHWEVSTSNTDNSNQRLSADGLPRQRMGYTTQPVDQRRGAHMTSETGASSDHQSCTAGEGKHREAADDDDTTVQSFDSATVGSPAMVPLYLASDDAPQANPATGNPAAAETPSTVSTAASTDDASLGDLHSMERSLLRGEGGQIDASAFMAQQQNQQQHRRVPSWEASPRQSHMYAMEQDNGLGGQVLPPAYMGQSAPVASPWGQQMVTSFRREHENEQGRSPFQALGDPRWQPRPSHARYGPQLPFLPGRGTPPIDNRLHRPQQSGFSPYPMHQRKPSGGGYSGQPALIPPGATTPPRGGRGQRPPQGASPLRQPQHSPYGPSASPSTPGGSRSSSEVLKTLLRKKACLYEPDTSRAVALVTWLVGRELALQFGFFSRQQLQAGVHACVSDKINSGAITRTKVNRCMQIILNSCFHYIIPRPDGTEENGEMFRFQFSREARDDSVLLRTLPEPWTDVRVDTEEILHASASETDPQPKKSSGSATETPQSSPYLGSKPQEKGSPGSKENDGDDHKRAVMLCFNENVRCAEDVFRCHNEFIRDTAHASNLQLSSQEWRLFFGPEAAGAPYLWGNIGIPVPFSEVLGPGHLDALGMLTPEEVGKFRTTWCTKRYDHDHELCGFAHAEINGGWLRRNPAILPYSDEMCPSVTFLEDKQTPAQSIIIHECGRGMKCEFAHSREELAYHPRRYKMTTCQAVGRAAGCHLGDVCPSFHPADSYRFPKKVDSRSSRHNRHAPQSGGGKGSHDSTPSGPAILFASPAPMSSFEQHLLLPGVQNLFRRNCSVSRAHLRHGGCTCFYSPFGDDDGVGVDPSTFAPKPQACGLPKPPGMGSSAPDL